MTATAGPGRTSCDVVVRESVAEVRMCVGGKGGKGAGGVG